MPYADILLPVFVTLFVVIDPIGLTPIFVSLTAGAKGAVRCKIAFQACFIAAVILILFALAGKHLLSLMGITLPAFQIAGGIMLFLIAVEMLFEKRTERRNKNASESADTSHFEPGAGDIAIFPLATPLIAGPGAAASIILLMGQHQGDFASQAVILAVMLAVLAITYVLFRLAGPFERFVGDSGIKVVTRIFGVILGALAVQFVLSGLQAAGFAPG